MIKRKLRSRRGFTLIEAVVTTLIMSLVGLAITAGTQSAIGAYNDSLFVSESDLLVNNMEIAMSDVLRFASYTGTSDNVVHFSNEEYGIKGGCFVLENGILFVTFKNTSDEIQDKKVQVINRSSYSNLRIVSFSMTYDPDTTVFEGSYTLQSKGDKTLERKIPFCFRSLRGPAIPVTAS